MDADTDLSAVDFDTKYYAVSATVDKGTTTGVTAATIAVDGDPVYAEDGDSVTLKVTTTGQATAANGAKATVTPTGCTMTSQSPANDAALYGNNEEGEKEITVVIDTINASTSEISFAVALADMS